MTDKAIIGEVLRLVDEGISVTLPVNGNSMLPFIVGGRDSVILQKPAGLKTGDVVLAWVEGCRYVLHRITSIDGGCVTLMGDGNLAATERCSVSDIKAVATHVVVKGGGKKRDLYGKRERLRTRLWQWLRPVRRYLLAIYHRMHNLG